MWSKTIMRPVRFPGMTSGTIPSWILLGLVRLLSFRVRNESWYRWPIQNTIGWNIFRASFPFKQTAPYLLMYISFPRPERFLAVTKRSLTKESHEEDSSMLHTRHGGWAAWGGRGEGAGGVLPAEGAGVSGERERRGEWWFFLLNAWPPFQGRFSSDVASCCPQGNSGRRGWTWDFRVT